MSGPALRLSPTAGLKFGDLFVVCVSIKEIGHVPKRELLQQRAQKESPTHGLFVSRAGDEIFAGDEGGRFRAYCRLGKMAGLYSRARLRVRRESSCWRGSRQQPAAQVWPLAHESARTQVICLFVVTSTSRACGFHPNPSGLERMKGYWGGILTFSRDQIPLDLLQST